MKKSGLFITLEGGEGCGKTTQAELLKEYFERQSKEVILTREPGGTKSAEEIRELLVKGDSNKLLGTTETLLHYAARYEHLEKLIKPSLSEDKVVISDRFFDSTIAYQGYGHKQDIKKIESIQSNVIGEFTPDITFIFDIEVEKGLKRAGKRFDESLFDDHEDRYENMGLEFHKRVRQGFLDIAKENPDRCVIINAGGSQENVHKDIIEKLKF